MSAKPIDVSDHFGDRWQSAKDAEWQSQLDAERALADDLADVLTNIRLPNGYQYPTVRRALARYREARQR